MFLSIPSQWNFISISSMKTLSRDTYLIVKRSQAGLGLFARRDIPRSSRVIEYVGPIITDDEADRRDNRYLFQVARNKVIDGSRRSNLARYINHGCKPNCYAEIDGKRVFIFAKRGIKAGEELSYHYGKNHFESFIKPKGCKCSVCPGAVRRAHKPKNK